MLREDILGESSSEAMLRNKATSFRCRSILFNWQIRQEKLVLSIIHIYINNFDDNGVNIVNRFTDDTKIGVNVHSEEGYLSLQQDPDQLGRWAKKLHEDFNSDIFEVLYFGMSNWGRAYTTNNRVPESDVEQRERREVDDSLKKSVQVDGM